MPRPNTIEVFLNEDHGHRLWIWTPNLTEQEFLLWWGDQTDSDMIGYFFDIRRLPGDIVPYRERRTGAKKEGVLQREPGDPANYTPYYYAHINDVDDSYIEIDRQRYNRRWTNRYWKEQWTTWHHQRNERTQNERIKDKVC
jgi:hypothetical protein